MSTLTAAEKTAVRNYLEKSGLTINYRKPEVDAAAQAVEDWIVANATSLSTAIDNASQPYGTTFTVAQKKLIVALTLYCKYLRDR